MLHFFFFTSLLHQQTTDAERSNNNRHQRRTNHSSPPCLNLSANTIHSQHPPCPNTGIHSNRSQHPSMNQPPCLHQHQSSSTTPHDASAPPPSCVSGGRLEGPDVRRSVDTPDPRQRLLGVRIGGQPPVPHAYDGGLLQDRTTLRTRNAFGWVDSSDQGPTVTGIGLIYIPNLQHLYEKLSERRLCSNIYFFYDANFLSSPSYVGCNAT